MTPASSAAGHPWWRWLGCLTLVGALFFTLFAAGPGAAMAPRAAFLVAFACVSGATLFASWQTPVSGPSSAWILGLPAIALTWAAHHPDGRGVQALVVLVSLLVAGTLVGSIIGSRVQAAGHLLFVALISSAADVFSVYAPLGPTSAAVDSPTALNLLALPWPMLGTDSVPPILGVGDVVFVSLYRSVARAHRLSSARTLVALVVAFAVTLAMLFWRETPVPALPFLGLAMVVAHPEARRVPMADRRGGWIGAIALLLVLGILASYRR